MLIWARNQWGLRGIARYLQAWAKRWKSMALYEFGRPSVMTVQIATTKGSNTLALASGSGLAAILISVAIIAGSNGRRYQRHY